MRPSFHGTHVINRPENVAVAGNKLTALQRMSEDDVPTVPFTDNREVAASWLPNKVVCRGTLRGHSGEGIVIASSVDELTHVALYTKYIKKSSEWRVHVFMGDVITVQRKVRSRDVPDEQVNWEVRNRQNGFIFQRNNEQQPDDLADVALSAIESLELDFGAVDIIFNQHHNQFYVLEVNTAPNLEGSTLTAYTEAIRNI
jgi:glutathione synthase/RimK-type ligase-like ATP-grasp enzyme